jgi:transposase
MKKEKKIVFKKYDYEQGELFPQNITEWIPENHLVRVINKVVEEIDISSIMDTFKGGGCPSFNPKMMLKVIIYAYSEKIYSCRRIAKALRENINFIWLSGRQTPDFRTINRFRLRLKKPIRKIFFKVVLFLIKHKYVDFKNYFLDGTKIEANANKFSFVWKRSNEKYKKMLIEKVKELFLKADEINKNDDLENKGKDLPELGEESGITSENLKILKDRINEDLKKNPKDKELKKKIKKIERDFLPRLKRYEEYEKTFAGRNSFSKTDKDSTFMRMKDDYMKNGQLKAGYNIQIGTENQFMLNYSVHQKTTDTSLLIPHFKELNKDLKRFPKNVIADAGYGSEENYEYLKREKIKGYVKYNMFRIEDTKKFKKDIFKKENFKYDKKKDEYECPNGKKLKYIYTKKNKTCNGYKIKQEIYECESCTRCKIKSDCTKSANNRRIQVNHRLDKLRRSAKKILLSEDGIKLRKLRGVEVASVFAHIKWNRGFNRFMLRGIEKVSLEWGLLGIAHNIRKLQAAVFLFFKKHQTIQQHFENLMIVN